MPMMMPSMVSAVRSRLAASERKASISSCAKFMQVLPRRRAVVDDDTVLQPHQALAARGHVGFVRDDDDGQALLAVERTQQVQHLFGGARVQVAGGLVGQQQRWLVDQRARDGHALLLPA
jgi:hypothetical protein